MFTSSPVSLVLFIVTNSNRDSYSNLALLQQLHFPVTFGFNTKTQMFSLQNEVLHVLLPKLYTSHRLCTS